MNLLALLLQVAAPAAPVLAPEETLLEVSAQGSIRATPDVASFTSGVIGDAATPEAALAAHAQVAVRLVDAARAAGVAAADLRTTELSVRPRFALDGDGNATDRTIGYRATSRLRIRVREIARASAVLGALIKAGATELSGPDFAFSDDAPLLRAARMRAVRVASEEAADYAKALGKRIVRTLRVSERRANATGGEEIMVTGRRVRTVPTPLVPIEPGQQEVSVSVWIDYALTSAR